MNKNILFAVGGLVVGAVLCCLFYKGTANKQTGPLPKQTQSNMQEMNHMDMSGEMSGMMTGLQGKTGDDFDKAFLSEMITHHQGAIDMANAALKDAKHQEIKTMANNIISAQTKEINQMKEWQASWYNIK